MGVKEEKEFEEKLRKSDLIKSEEYQKVRAEQLEMIVGFANSNYDDKEIRGMLKLISKTDEWVKDFEKIQGKRR